MNEVEFANLYDRYAPDVLASVSLAYSDAPPATIALRADRLVREMLNRRFESVARFKDESDSEPELTPEELGREFADAVAAMVGAPPRDFGREQATALVGWAREV